ncbi:MAG: hypothetical protein SFY69_07850 [Planctomycetota bacterium]|nr:hypothetical protein [Planctomycetota bacterium]
MAQKRKSFDDSAKGVKATGSGPDKSGTIKLVVAIVALVGACAFLAYFYGVFDSPPTPPPTLEQTLGEEGLQQLEESKKVNERLMQIHKKPAGS